MKNTLQRFIALFALGALLLAASSVIVSAAPVSGLAECVLAPDTDMLALNPDRE